MEVMLDKQVVNTLFDYNRQRHLSIKQPCPQNSLKGTQHLL